ncbi:MAG: radical SAM protein [Candidatus Bipolaricaulota bacterium]|nr:radical SAM protein [Candidatus Bipolaricaulota bacterium]MDW8126321.1 radical SAM protein [Candidatus Bipolaricaulota bacterium]
MIVRCPVCGEKRLLSQAIGVCGRCLREDPAAAKPFVEAARRRSRRIFGLPETPPQDPQGLPCTLCVHGCRIPENGTGFCGLPPRSRESARLSWYYDPLPTNCVASFVCPGGTGAGYPRFARKPGPEYGYQNLAVFYEACSFDCLYCQNWHYRVDGPRREPSGPETLVEAVKPSVSCICFFGGDPTPQLPHALSAAEGALRRYPGQILRICFETNGSMNSNLLERALELSLRTGGVIKFDLKAWTPSVHYALTGAENSRTLANFLRVAQEFRARPEVPLLVASVLLVPGYVDAEEVQGIANFIANVNPAIPLSLLAFYPNCLMDDLPCTSWAHMGRCILVAKEAGLKNVHIGNRHLLWRGDYEEGACG